MGNDQEIAAAISRFQYLGGEQSIPKYFWAIASQFRANSLGDVLHTLIDRSNLTVRNVMTYRYLGLLKKQGEDIVRTPAGETLVSSYPEEQQRILDMQISKIWLCNPTNPRMKIDVYPFEVLVQILLAVHEITWEEYLVIVMWIQDESEIPIASRLIGEFRTLSGSQRSQLVSETELRSGSQDLENQARRLHRAISAHSLLLRNAANSLVLTVSERTASEYLDKFQAARAEGAPNYASFLENESTYAPKEVELEPINNVLDYREVLLETPVQRPPARPAAARALRKIDYGARAQSQALSGLRAEHYVFDSEKSRLLEVGRPDLSERVNQISLTDDGAGFDILSFADDGTEKHIEVKSVGSAQGNCSIFISKNEVAKAISDPSWELVLVIGNGTTKPYLWVANPLRQAILDANFEMPLNQDELQINATQFQITFRIALAPDSE